jgi:hypothetical protein
MNGLCSTYDPGRMAGDYTKLSICLNRAFSTADAGLVCLAAILYLQASVPIPLSRRRLPC